MLQLSSTPTAQQPSEVLHRGELLLRPDEADDLNTSIAESGMQFEEVGYPADPPSPPARRTRAKAKAKSAARRRKAASSPSSSQAATSPGSPGPAQPPATLRNGAPKRRGRPSKAASPPPSSESEEGDQAIALPKLEGLAETRRAALLGVLEGIKKDGQKRQEKDRISYWYGTASFPEQIEGAKPRAYQLPTDLATIRKNVQEGKYETHLAMEKDINKIVRHGLRNFPSDSGPFRAAERLNKLAADLVQKASYKINNEDYKEKYVSTEVMAAIFSKDGGQSETNTARENHRSKSGKKKRGSKGAKGSEGSEQNLDSLNKQIAQLQEKLAMLVDKGISLTQPPATSPGTPPEGGSPGRGSQAHLPLTIDEKNKLEDDMNQLTAEDLALVVEKKLKGRPGVVLDDATGQLCELDVDLMSPRDQRNLKRYVARLLNLHNQKVKENEERAREIVAHERAVAQLQAERAMKRKRRDEDDGSSSSGSSSDSSSGSSSSSGSDSSDDEASDRDELARIYEKGAAAQ